jgi:hypothetical protein
VDAADGVTDTPMPSAFVEPDKTLAVQWFDVAALPIEVTQTARNAIGVYLEHCHLAEASGADSDARTRLCNSTER